MKFALHVCLLTTLLISTLRSSAAPCYSNGQYRDYGNLVHKVEDYYEGTPRIPLDNLTGEQKNKYAATGKIVCNGFEGSAQLSEKKNLITTVGHMLTDYNCRRIANATDCKFTIRSHNRNREIGIKRLVGTGFKCPSTPVMPDDWAVMELDGFVDDVNPYLSNPAKVAALKAGSKVVTVAHSIDFKVDGKYPMTYNQCGVLDVFGRGSSPTMVTSTCGCSGMCSGGSLLSDDTDRSLLGVWIQNLETKEMRTTETSTGIPLMAHAKNGHGSYYVPLAGDFLKTLTNAANQVSL